MRILITGISGFVARHYLELLSSFKKEVWVTGIYNENPPKFKADHYPLLHLNFKQINLLDKKKVATLIQQFNPSHIVHLASKSSVVHSWKNPEETISVNSGIFLSILEGLRTFQSNCRLLSVGSSEEYGSVPEMEMPLVESASINPVSPYGISRVMQQQLATVYSNSYGLDIVHTRSFNHIGPYQRPTFVLSSFARQISDQLKLGNKKIELAVGNIEVVRDFTDVRDVVKAYYMLQQNGTSGEVYNICSGKGVILRDLLKIFESITDTKINCFIDPQTFHPSENRQVIGSYQKINSATGWMPEIPIEKTLKDLLQYWAEQN